MKKIFKVLLLLLIPLTFLMSSCCSSKDFSEPEKTVLIDSLAFKYVITFIDEAEKFGINTDIIKDSIDDIVSYPLDQDTYGLYSPYNRQIVINSNYQNDSIILKKVIYHELGHLFGLSHDTRGIMKTHVGDYEIHKVYCPLEGGSDKVWEIHKAYLFYNIKKKELGYDN